MSSYLHIFKKIEQESPCRSGFESNRDLWGCVPMKSFIEFFFWYSGLSSMKFYDPDNWSKNDVKKEQSMQ